MPMNQVNNFSFSDYPIHSDFEFSNICSLLPVELQKLQVIAQFATLIHLTGAVEFHIVGHLTKKAVQKA